MAVEDAGIIDSHLLHLVGLLMQSLLDKGLCHGRYIPNATIQPHSCVDTVRQQIACHSGAGSLFVHAPERLTSLRKIGTDRPVLKKVGPVVKDPSELSGIDDLLCQSNCRDSPVVVPDRVLDTGALHSLKDRKSV